MIPTDRLVAAVTERLALAGCVAADEEAVDLVAAAPDARTLDAWVLRREHGEPPAWITGAHRFGGRTVRVEPGVYVPRWQSEELAQRAAQVLPRHGRAIDLCTGAGAVAAYLAAAVPTAAVTGVDLDVRAAACARRNGVATVVADVAATLPLRCRADVVTAVAPYVPSGEIGLLPADVQRFEPR
ncbi:MAG: methyltransferase, partial [Acidimicrobiales bacterium]|nr:methyltransferase [Acidimicrobiales bacterium]